MAEYMIGRILSFLMIAMMPVMAMAQSGFPDQAGVVPGVIMVKVKATSSSNLRTAGAENTMLDFIQNNFQTKKIEGVLPLSKNGRTTQSQSGLERIFTIELDENEDLLRAIQQIKMLDGVEYAEPLYENVPLYITNDPYANPNSGSQYHLKNIKAYEAWDIEKGDTSVVIGVIDTGVDMDHNDLFPNIYINYNDPINGIDDDGDGYIDNYYGWDMADNDNNPNSDTNEHGDVVAGISSAKTNNGLGVAGVGFNSRFLPVKIMENATGKLRNEYAGVIYAANHGAKVINLSWGSPWGYSKFAQDVINYAVLDMDVVVIAAAGNTHDHIDFYPASFDNVLSVTASDASDNFANWATYSYKVDIMAPGQSIVSTKGGGGYGNGGFGTSFAAPMVAGAAALVRSKYPNLDARQVMERLRVTADDVSHIGTNSQFNGKIGKGRLNAYRALTDTLKPSVRLQEFSYTGNYGNYIFPGDTIKIFPSFINYLSEAKNLSITLSSADTHTLYNQKSYLINSLKTYQIKAIDQDYWEVVLAEDLLPGTKVYFRIDYETGGYSDYEYFSINTSPSYFDVKNNNFSLTVSSDGDLAYDKDSFNWGNGIWLDFDKISNYMGLMLTRDKNYVADNLVNNYSILTKDKDFEAVKNARMFNNSLADVDARSTFRERDNFNKLGVEIEQKILGWEDHPDNNFFLLEYRVVNKTDALMDSLNVAFFADYNLKEKDKNAAGYDPVSGISYTYNSTGSQIYAGLALLTSGESTAYAIDLLDKNGNVAEMGVKFPDTLKHKFATSSFDKITAGTTGEGNDVATLVGLKNISLNTGESKKVAFVAMAGTSLEGLKEQLERAKSRYEEYLNNPPLEYYTESCKGGYAELRPRKADTFEVYAEAQMIQKLDSGTLFSIASVEKDTSFYIVEIIDGIREDVRKATIVLKEPVADFVTSKDTLLLSGETLDTIKFINKTIFADQFSWDFGNGYFSTVSNPVVQYKEAGSYQVKMIAKNDLGCADTVLKVLEVVERSHKPVLNEQILCRGTQAIVSATNTSKIRVYSESDLKFVVYEGDEFVSDPLMVSTKFYVTNIDGHESLPKEINITVSNPKADFKYSVDISSGSQLLKVENLSSNAKNLQWHINNQLLSDQDVVHYDYSDDVTIGINLLAYDSLACEDSKELSLIPAESPVPVVEDQEICVNGSVSIKPQGGINFLFYGDSEKIQFLGSGAELVVDEVKADRNIYVSNIDSLKESKLAHVKILVNDFKARIAIRQDTINLSETNTVEISNTSIGASSSYWVWPSGSVDTTKNLIRTIVDPGNYTFTVVAKSGEACIDTASASLYAYMVTDVVEYAEWSDEIKLFPNPASDQLRVTLAADNPFREIDILNNSGQVVYNRKISSNHLFDFDINTSALSNGFYLLRLHGENDRRVFKFVINH